MSPCSSWCSTVIFASASIDVRDRDRDWPDAVDVTALAGERVAAFEGSTVEMQAHVGRGSWSVAEDERGERVGGVRGAQLGGARLARGAEQLIGLLLEHRHDAGADVGGELRVQRKMSVAARVGAGAARVVQTPRACGVVGRAHGHLAALVAHGAERPAVACRGQELGFGLRICSGTRRDLRRLGAGELAVAIRLRRRRELFEPARGLELAGCLTHAGSRRRGEPLGRVAVPSVLPVDPVRHPDGRDPRPAPASRSQRVNRSTKVFAPRDRARRRRARR